MALPLAYSGRDLFVAALTLYGECRGEPLEGQQAVAWVIRNRAEWKPGQWWGNTVERVCLKPSQFSCWNASDPNWGLLQRWLSQRADDWREQCPALVGLAQVAESVFKGKVEDPTGRATHYEVLGTGAKWARNREFSKIIGRHAFYAIGPE